MGNCLKTRSIDIQRMEREDESIKQIRELKTTVEQDNMKNFYKHPFSEIAKSTYGIEPNSITFEEGRDFFNYEKNFGHFEDLQRNNEIPGRSIWEYLIDILTDCTFRPYIFWTGNGLEFRIEKSVVVFTELYEIRRGERPSTMLDPLARWSGKLIAEDAANWYLARMLRRTANGPRIVKSGENCFYFDDHIQICDRLEWDLNTLLNYIAENVSDTVVYKL